MHCLGLLSVVYDYLLLNSMHIAYRWVELSRSPPNFNVISFIDLLLAPRDNFETIKYYLLSTQLKKTIDQTQPSKSACPDADKASTNSSSRYLDTAIWSPSPFLRRVFRTRSRANACPDAGSSGRSLMLVSVGSPGTMDQWSKTCRQKAWPCVAVRRSVSNPFASITGIKALTV